MDFTNCHGVAVGITDAKYRIGSALEFYDQSLLILRLKIAPFTYLFEYTSRISMVVFDILLFISASFMCPELPFYFAVSLETFAVTFF